MKNSYSTFYITKEILKYCYKSTKLHTILLILLPALQGCIPFISAYIFKLIIDSFMSGYFEHNISQFIVLGLSLVSINFISSLLYTLQEYSRTRLKYEMAFIFGYAFLNKLNKLPYTAFENPEIYDKIYLTNQNIDWRPSELLIYISNLSISFITVVIGIITTFYIAWWISPLIILSTVPKFFFSNKINDLQIAISDSRSPYARMHGYLTALLSSSHYIKETKLYNSFNRLYKKIDNIFTKFRNQNRELARKKILIDIVIQLLNSIGEGISYIYIFTQTINKTISLGTLTFVLTSVSEISNNTNKLFSSMSTINNYAKYLKYFFEVLDLPEEKTTGNKLKDMNFKKIEFKNVSFKYSDSDIYIYKDLNITINRGDKLAIVGINGSGKTTIIKLLLRLYEPTSGEILIDGKNINTINKYDYLKYFGVLFQDYLCYAFSVQENIEFGDPNKDSTELYKQAKDLSDADSVINNLPNKDAQLLTKEFQGGVDLSGGQWQRIALARMYYRDSPILILDEPTASIDALSEAKIFESVQNLSHDKTVIIISHRFSTVRNAERIIVLAQGKIVEQGTHEELISNMKGQYYKMFTAQAKGYI